MLRRAVTRVGLLANFDSPSLETLLPRSWSRDLVAKVLVLVSRPGGQGLGLGLETWWPRSWSWSRAFFKGLDNKSAYNIESHKRIKQILIFGDKILLLPWWVTFSFTYH